MATSAGLLGGSSPLTRGAQLRDALTDWGWGLIPAYAGRTSVDDDLSGDHAAHPRLRGAHGRDTGSKAGRGGSSPLTRGARHDAGSAAARTGLIPAYAGRTNPARQGRARQWAHPRLRGAHSSNHADHAVHVGSSPLTRGAPGSVTTGPASPGLIPAYAGRTLTRTVSRRGRRAHPRLRGAHHGELGNVERDLGSSPLTRGARWFCLVGRRWRGLIPAYAGRTDWNVWEPGVSGAHPRLRGAHAINWVNQAVATGSSPLTRGAPQQYGADQGWRGLIPAYAGRTG